MGLNKEKKEGEEEKEEVTRRTTQRWMGREVRRVEKVDLGCLGGGSMNMIKYD